MSKNWTEVRDYGKQSTDGMTPLMLCLVGIMSISAFVAGILFMVGLVLLWVG